MIRAGAFILSAHFPPERPIMKRTILGLLAGIAVASFSQASSAADMAIKAAPVIAPVTTWTGLYLGVHGGAAWQSAPNWSAVDPNGLTLPATLTGSTNLGAVGGIQGGYNWQFAPAWVVGVEGDISWASLGDHPRLRQSFSRTAQRFREARSR